MHKLNEIERNRIEGIVARLRNAVDAYAIMQWLENFTGDEDRGYALSLLEKMEYRTSEDIYAIIDRHLADIGRHHRSCKVYMVPFGKLGKSGSLIAYYTKKSIKERNAEKFIILSPEELKRIDDETIGKSDVLCLMDDFVGSGNTIKKAYEEYRSSYERFTKRYAFLIGYMPKGMEVTKELGLKVLGDKHEPIFQRRGSVLGYEQTMKKLRKFAYRYGQRLVPRYKKGQPRPLGYMNSQALIAFDYTCPNNTLPILWSSSLYRRKKGTWYALFQRFADDFVQRLSNARRNYWLWVSKNKELDSPFEYLKGNEEYTIQKVRLFMLIELIHSRRSRNGWETLMSMTSAELNKLITEAKENHFVNEEMQLTENARQLLREVHRGRRKLYGEETKIEIDSEIYKYVPRKFMGGS